MQGQKQSTPCIETVRGMNSPIIDRRRLDELYAYYDSRDWVHPDPLEFLYAYQGLPDREVVGLIASALAYGRVEQILKSVSMVLKKIGPSPRDFLERTTPESMNKMFCGFKHRFTTGKELVGMLMGAKSVIEKHGSLYACFLSGLNQGDETVFPALSSFVKAMSGQTCEGVNSLLPLPERGSACKRWNLFLRWMVREDNVDPGGWHGVNPAMLIVPLDTHMHRICLGLGLTGRKNTSIRTALDITRAFREIIPQDPVRYDFALTRLGIRKDADPESFMSGVWDPLQGPCRPNPD